MNENFNADYFTLVAHKIINENDINYYYFILGYINPSSLKLNLYYYKIDSISQSINCESSLINYDNSMRYTGLSCKFVLYESDEYIFCIYETHRTILLVGWDNDMYFDFFKINQNSIASSDKIEHEKLEIKYISSAINSLDSDPFYCGITESGLSKCLVLDYDYPDSDYIYDDDNEEKCMIEPYNVKTYYFPDTDEYIFSCLTKNYKIQTTIYNKNMNDISNIQNPSMRLLRSCEGCNNEFYYSIIYNKVKRKYYIISDMDCGIYGKFFPLIEGDIDDEEEEKRENEKENIKEKEENKSKQEEELEKESKNEKEHSENEKEKEKEKEKAKEKEKEKNKGNEKEKDKENEKEKEKEKENEKEKEKEKENEKEKEKVKEKETEKEKEAEKEKEKENKEKENKEIEHFIEKENQSQKCILEKCSECTEESTQFNLCKKCNTEKEYYPLNTGENILTNQYINCYNEITKPKGFYLDKIEEQYKLCYSSCLTCDYGGDGIENNCTSCKNNQILKPDIRDSTNCVIKCSYFYYYQGDQYKCTKTENCPDTYQFEINEKRKCIEKCEKDNEYHIQYDGECYKVPPEGTVYDAIVKISKDADITKCKLNEKVLRLLSNDNITEHEIETKAKLYAEEFHYTNKHVTVYKNDIYNITIYKDKNCFSDLELKLDEIDFDECNEKIKQDLNIEDNLIIVILSKLINGIPTLIDVFVFNPNTGEKINYMEICGEETLIIKKDLRNQIMYSENIESMEDLTEQGINIFDPDSDFYTDICFHFKSPIDGKDIPLKDRLRLFYPNITLCNEGCSIKGVNLTSWKAICECKLRDLVQNNIFGNNLVIQKTIGEVQDILMKTNIEVLKCYKDLFNLEMYKQILEYLLFPDLFLFK